MRSLASRIARLSVFNGARNLLKKNENDWNLPLSKLEKLYLGSYMILQDYGEGIFPPVYEDEETSFQAEIDYYDALENLGVSMDHAALSNMRKPFWGQHECALYLGSFVELLRSLEICGIHPPARILEVGCGSGWMSEFLVARGYEVVASTIDPVDESQVARRRKSLEVKGLPTTLHFTLSPMEYVHEKAAEHGPYDAVFVYEALHHAYDWSKSIDSFYKSLKEGGWCLLLREPNLLHTFVSYRVGKLSNTHEIGMSSAKLRKRMKECGFRGIKILRHRMHFWTRSIWLAAQR